MPSDSPDGKAKKPDIWDIGPEPLLDNNPKEPHGLFLDSRQHQVYSEEMQFDMPTYPATQLFTPEEERAMEEDFEEEQLFTPPQHAGYFNTGTDAEFDELAEYENSDIAIY